MYQLSVMFKMTGGCTQEMDVFTLWFTHLCLNQSVCTTFVDEIRI